MTPEDILFDGIKAAVDRVNFTLQRNGRAFAVEVRREVEMKQYGANPVYSIALVLVLPQGYKFGQRERNQKSDRIRTLYEFRNTIEYKENWEMDYLAAFLAYLLSFAIAGHGSPVAARIEQSADDVRRTEQLPESKKLI